MIPEISFVLTFLNGVFLQGDFFGIGGGGALGSADPLIKGIIPTVFGILGFSILLNLFNAMIRRKLIDRVKLKRIMKETRAWQKERMAAFRSKDQEKIAEMNKKSAYMNKMSMEMMQMNMRPMMITIIPLLLIFYFVLPALFFYTSAVSPIPLNVIPGDFFQLTCNVGDVIATPEVTDPVTGEVLKDDLGQPVTEEIFCEQDNGLFLWAWYFLTSIAFSGIIMKVTNTSMDLS